MARNDENGYKSVSDNPLYQLAERLIFDQRYFLMVAYLTFAASLVSFVAKTSWNTVHYCIDIWNNPSEEIVIGMLDNLDAIMVANVAFLICAGSYLVYVRGKADELSARRNPPLALQNLTGTTLKEKMAASLVGVSSINLLALMLDTGVLTADGKVQDVDWFSVAVKVGIHFVLIIGLVVFMKVSQAEHAEQHEAEQAEHKPHE